jgi:protein O-GlcNAc transferase
MIAKDEIDILVDLSGHTARNRLPMFALRSAPVQASWLGYFGTTGLNAMDYLIMDEATVPSGEERWCGEALVRLPHGRFCYAPPDYAPSPAEPPAARRGHVTFGSFNNIAKIGPDVMSLWADVLRATPQSRLVLKWKSLADEDVRERLAAAFLGVGVSAERLDLRGHSGHTDMLAEYGDIDVALDPFPFGGGLTSCEALWMGLPIVTWPGDRPASRQTLGFLKLLDLERCVARSRDDYVRIAAGLAAAPDGLAALRRQLRPRMAASPLCDGRRFTPTLEAAFREMWRRWGAGEEPKGFEISADGSAAPA